MNFQSTACSTDVRKWNAV